MASGIEGDVVGKLIKLDVDVSHFELVVSEIRAKDQHYAGTILVSDLQNRRCITYNLGNHWSRLEGVVGISRCDAFLVSKWLNSFPNIEMLFELEVVSMTYKLTAEDRREAHDCGLGLVQEE